MFHLFIVSPIPRVLLIVRTFIPLVVVEANDAPANRDDQPTAQSPTHPQHPQQSPTNATRTMGLATYFGSTVTFRSAAVETAIIVQLTIHPDCTHSLQGPPRDMPRIVSPVRPSHQSVLFTAAGAFTRVPSTAVRQHIYRSRLSRSTPPMLHTAARYIDTHLRKSTYQEGIL